MLATNSVTVEEAIARGRSMLLLPRILIMLGFFFFVFIGWIFCEACINTAGGNFLLIFGLIWVVSFLPLVLLPFLFWSKRTTRWKIWAFENVPDVQELKRRAMRAALYADDGTFINRIQIKSTSEAEAWAALQYKFKQPAVFIDDPNIPDETIVRFSKFYIISLVMCLLVFIIGACCLYFAFKPVKSPFLLSLIGVGLMVYAGIYVFRIARDLTLNKPQIIINSKGIQTQAAGFNSWAVIHGEEVKLILSSKGANKHVLHYYYPKGTESLNIASFDISWKKLETLLIYYRNRYEQQTR